MTDTPSRVKMRLRSTLAPVITGLFIVLFGFGLLTISQDGHPLSVVDEHIHFDTAIAASHGEIPWRGALLTQELVEEWACGVGHEGGSMPYPCGDPRLSPEVVPSGKYTTGYIHYPTYFFAAAAFQPAWEALTGNASALDGYRAFSAVTIIAGLVASAAMAWLLRLRGAMLVAATTLPVAASMLVFVGTIVNPTSLSLLPGALIAGTSLLWIRRGRGFVWVALSVALGASIAVTVSLAAGATLVAMLVVLIGRRFGMPIASDWRPRWWQFVVLSAIILAPVVIWGRVISARATVSNDALYGFIAPSGRKDITVGIVREVSALHTPWRETGGIHASPTAFVPRLLQGFSEGAPSWITVMVFGALVIALIVEINRVVTARRRTTQAGIAISDGDRALSPFAIFAGGALATIVLYPPALRVSNWITFGFDFPIVDRYSSALAPVLILALLVWLPRRPVVIVVAAAVGLVTALGTVAAGF